VAAAGSRIDILVNVAGIMDHYLPLGDLDDETLDRGDGREGDGRHAMQRRIQLAVAHRDSLAACSGSRSCRCQHSRFSTRVRSATRSSRG
jgi:hypothetical protein